MESGTRQRSSGALESMVTRSVVPYFVGLESLEKEHFESVFGYGTLLASILEEKRLAEEAERRKKEDEDIVKLLATCRQYLNDGDMQEAYEVIQRAKKTYRDNLRIEAFEWNYLRM